jgi:hypothetical protein
MLRSDLQSVYERMTGPTGPLVGMPVALLGNIGSDGYVDVSGSGRQVTFFVKPEPYAGATDRLGAALTSEGYVPRSKEKVSPVFTGSYTSPSDALSGFASSQWEPAGLSKVERDIESFAEKLRADPSLTPHQKSTDFMEHVTQQIWVAQRRPPTLALVTATASPWAGKVIEEAHANPCFDLPVADELAQAVKLTREHAGRHGLTGFLNQGREQMGDYARRVAEKLAEIQSIDRPELAARGENALMAMVRRVNAQDPLEDLVWSPDEEVARVMAQIIESLGLDPHGVSDPGSS